MGKYLIVADRNMVPIGYLQDADQVQRKRRINSDYNLSFTLPMTSGDYDKIMLKGHVKDERGQFYIVNEISRDRTGNRLMAKIDCTHVMFKLTDFLMPYASYIDEAYGVNISTLTDLISAATHGKYTFVIGDTFDLKDIKDFGRGNAMQALAAVIDAYGCEVDPNNFVITLKKRIGGDAGLQYRYRKNIISGQHKNSTNGLVTRLYGQMKDGLSIIGLPASNLTTDEYARLNAIPGAIVGGVLQVNYLISQFAAYWANDTNTYYDGEHIDQNIDDPVELLKAMRKELEINEVPAIEVKINAADLFKIDHTEPKPGLGDTVYLIDPDMQLNKMTARIVDLTEYPFARDKHTDATLANYMLQDMTDILAGFDASKRIVDNIMSGGVVRAGAFEAFARQAVIDINNSKTEVKYDGRGIVLQDKVNALNQVILSSNGLYLTTDGGATARAAVTAAGVVAERVVGVLGNFIRIEIGSGDNVFKSDSNGIYLGNQVFNSAPFRVNMGGQLFASSANITGTINATGGTFSGNITAFGTITGGSIVGADLSTRSTGAKIQIGAVNNSIDFIEGSDVVTRMSSSSGGFPQVRIAPVSGGSADLNIGPYRYVIGWGNWDFQNALVSGLKISSVAGLQGLLDNKAPIIHTHSISDVTGLQAALNGKSDIGHTHGNLYVKSAASQNVEIQYFSSGNYLEVFEGGSFRGTIPLV
ncbi:phage tail spike protein [Paenibacillus cymbidii]|uniref:phage tail spike protein n=1 Tax=Paenibacillus cymbidii TaxID=1639034 RepID=UPI0010817485|nr:phage tail spike protein [Paenibacillus cymbidii]